VRSSILSFELSSAARTPKQQRCPPMPAECLLNACQLPANACQYPDNVIQCHPVPASALQWLAGKLCQARSRLACPMGASTGSISSFRRVGLLFLTQGSFRGPVRLGRRASSQAGSTCMSVCRARRLPPPLRTPPIHHHGCRRLRVLPMAGFCALCERSACYPACHS